MLGFAFDLITNTHMLCAAAGALAVWGVVRVNSLIAWYNANSSSLSKATGVTLPATVAQAKAQAAKVAPTVVPDIEKLVADVEKKL